LEGNSPGLMELLSQNFLGGAVETRRKFQDSRYPGRESNRAHLELKSRALPLDQPLRLINYCMYAYIFMVT
jgi:hypothetical protein